ncbi:MAG: Lipoprotein signal peptidase [Chlamydiae bacterium]|nr:Lipoprotein signal peptidase [Chlamydiota bacterium]
MKKAFRLSREELSNYSRIAWLLLFGLAVLLVDFLTKAYVYYLFPVAGFSAHFPYGGIGVFQNFLGIDFAISLAVNRGAAWGVMANFQNLLLAIRLLVISGMLIYLIFLNRNRRVSFPLTLIIAGAIGNIVDYFLYGFVVDFFHFNFWGYHFPVFNVADSAITIGVIWLFIVGFFGGSQKASC